ncbi:MAG TPA: hypothetical protein PKM73_09295 [Verrucomicrobiota bacterium]|nr:hypothetical protein [Verrucomicrobiota bacterium]HNU52000.1 hypothetical protein [Verrucomicrobiota bacterium]
MSTTAVELYAPAAPVGLLKGFSPVPHQLEVEVVVPHHDGGLPGFGEFLLVELTPTEAVVGRVSRYHAAGQLATERGDAYLVDLAKTQDTVPAPLMRQMLRYNLKMQLLGQLQVEPQHAEVVKGDVYVDFGDFPPQDIVAAFVSAEKQETVFANLLRSLEWSAWRRLVALLATDGYRADEQEIAKLLGYKPRKDDVSLGAIKNNLVPPLRRLHQSGATLGKNLIEELKQNRVVIADVSLLGGEDGLAITGMLLRRIFQHNVRHLTDVAGQTVRCLAILEEAQTMLGERTLDDRNVFVRWVKEGRKYGLGCVLVTQQPSSISNQIISQDDNFFVFHLLNENDLQTLKRHNAHFSDEILGFIRAEPIRGNCYFWSAPSQPFVLPARVCNFESVCERPVPSAAAAPAAKPDSKRLSGLTARAVHEALVSGKRVWLYPVSSLHGKKESGLVAFSRDYLQEAVAKKLTVDAAFRAMADGDLWLRDRLPLEIETVLTRHKLRQGYAVLAGTSRAVWVLPQAEIKLQKGKVVQSEPVDVLEKM